MDVTILDELLKAFPVFIRRAQQTNNPSGTPEGVTFDGLGPIPESRAASAVVATRKFQLVVFVIDVIVIRLLIRVRVVTSCILGIGRNFKPREIWFRSGSDGSNDVGGADIDYVGITPDAIVLMVEADHANHLAFGQQALELFHGRCVVPGVVESDVADLKRGLTCKHIGIRE
jgi:hypothetical protein